MRELKKFVKNNYIVIISFLATLFLYFGNTLLNKIYPFGNETFIYSDMYEQYVTYFNYLRDMILSGESLFASFSFSLGQNFYGILTYFCISPLNLIFLLSNNANMPAFILIVVALKLALSSMNMAILLKTKLKSNLSIFVFSLIYGLMTFNITYSVNVMWLDPVYLLPLIVLGLERIAKGKPILYIVTLTIAMCSNYYISFSVCIFLILYFIYYSLLNKVEFKKFLFNFIKYSIISALLSAVVLIPTIFNMIAGKLETTGTDFSFDIMYNPINLLYKFLVSDSKFILNDLPQMTSSLLVLVMIIMYLFCKNITKKEKIITYIFIAILILITLFPFTDTIMHCLRLPNQFTYRYAFIISFFLILTASKTFDEANFNYKNVLIYLPIIGLIYLYLKLYIDFKTVVSSIFVGGYFLSCLFFKNKRLLSFVIVPFVLGELLINLSADFNPVKREEYGRYQKLFIYSDKIDKLKPNQDEFYRISGIDRISFNDAIAYKYYGVTSFSPTISVNTNRILKDYFGLPLNPSYAVEYLPATAFTDAFLNVKYKYKTQEDFEFFENENVFPVMFKMKQNSRFKEGETLIETQNNLYKYLSDTDEILFSISNNYEIEGCKYENNVLISTDVGYCTFINDDKENRYYIEISNSNLELVPLYDGISTTTSYAGKFILEINKGARAFLSKDETELEYLNVYKLDSNKLKELTKQLNLNGIKITSHGQNKITGTIENNEKDEIMFTSIPYDEGWHAYINGKEVETFKNLDSLLAFKLPEGNLEIEIVFIPKGFIAGLFISLFTLDLLVVIKVMKKSKEI